MKIREAKGRKDGESGYTRVLGNDQLGCLISRIQSTVISNGTELERMIVKSSTVIKDIEEFIDQVMDGRIDDGVYLCQKTTMKKSKRYAVKGIQGIEPDLLIFTVHKNLMLTFPTCKIVELKDGDMFDTKKAQGEREHLEQFATNFGSKIPFVTEYYICCFNQDDKEKILEGFKREFTKEHILTGRELCDILKIDYKKIKEQRKADTEDNFRYFMEELLKIPDVQEYLREHMIEHNS